jgi:hypothetical protein
MWPFRRARCAAAVAHASILIAALSACGGGGSGPVRPAAFPIVFAAGDIVGCEVGRDEATAAIVAKEPSATVVTLGDNAYEDGTIHDFFDCFASSWGHFKHRLRPATGDHEYRTEGAAGYFRYFHGLLERFGPSAGDLGRGWYSFDVQDWHFVVLNSNCRDVGGCEAGSPQERWLRGDLADRRSFCTLAVLHYPRFSSGLEPSSTSVQPLWQALYDDDADVVLSGHNHAYERFAPQTPTGKLDRQRGIREFVVGTGGRSHYRFPRGRLQPTSEVRNETTFGVLKLVLAPDRYSWRFLPIAGERFSDSGRSDCH